MLVKDVLIKCVPKINPSTREIGAEAALAAPYIKTHNLVGVVYVDVPHGPIIFYRTGSPVRKCFVGYWSKPFRINDRQYTRRYIFPRSLKLVSYTLLCLFLFSPE
jgi:hypothetical protein